MDIKPAFYIISAARKGAKNNVARHATLKPAVAKLGAVKHVTGQYKGDPEQAWLLIENPLDGQNHKQAIRHLLTLYSQECALFVDCNRGAWYVYPDKPDEFQGSWVSVRHVGNLESFTTDPTSRYHYTIK